MKQYWVDGVYIAAGRKKSAGGEPFYRSFWADSPEEALRMASEAIEGGKWVSAPKISTTSEEERMRRQGAPELPLFGDAKGAKKAKK